MTGRCIVIAAQLRVGIEWTSSSPVSCFATFFVGDAGCSRCQVSGILPGLRRSLGKTGKVGAPGQPTSLGEGEAKHVRFRVLLQDDDHTEVGTNDEREEKMDGHGVGVGKLEERKTVI